MKKLRKIFAVALALMLAVSAMSFTFAAEDTSSSTNAGRVISGYDPIPLLVIKVNFDTDGDGQDCYEYVDESGERVRAGERYLADLGIKTSVYHGEQYCYSADSYWANLCFGENFGSLNDYYKYISNDRFYWIPAEETSGTANDGVITVTVNAKHPCTADSKGLTDGNERILALDAADEFVDFSKYDKDGSGDIDFTELSIVFIYGGTEVSYNAKTGTKYAYPTHAHVSYVVYGKTLDGVSVYKSSLPYVRMGEYRGGTSDEPWAQMGKLAHELGHVLGAKDLYIDSKDWIGSCGDLSLMGGGSGGKNNGVSSPTVLDPYYKVLYGFADETVATYSETGIEYTLYSHESTVGEFNVLRINISETEYLLLENRSHSSTGYDNNDLNDVKIDDNLCEGSMQGILIWHIDESIISSTARPNNGNEGHAPGFTIISPTNCTYDVDADSTWSKDSASSVFYASNEAQYVFMVSTPDNKGSWHTSLTEEQAAACNIKVEFLTSAGDEMVVRVTGANDLPVKMNAATAGSTTNSLTINAGITDYNGAEILSCKVTLSENKDLSNATVQTVEPDENGKYLTTFTGLKADTEYFFEVVMETTHGNVTKSSSTYTNPEPVEKTKATITININGDLRPSTTTKLKVGEVIEISSALLVKKGYTLEGWYLDEAFTQPYDITKPIESTDDFAIYAKWVEDTSSGSDNTTSGNVTPGGDNTQGGDDLVEEPGVSNGLPTAVIVVIVVAAVVVVGGGAAVAIVVVNKKKTK